MAGRTHPAVDGVLPPHHLLAARAGAEELEDLVRGQVAQEPLGAFVQRMIRELVPERVAGQRLDVQPVTIHCAVEPERFVGSQLACSRCAVFVPAVTVDVWMSVAAK